MFKRICFISYVLIVITLSASVIMLSSCQLSDKKQEINTTESNMSSEESDQAVSTDTKTETGSESVTETVSGSQDSDTDSNDTSNNTDTSTAAMIQDEGDVEIIIPEGMDSDGF